MPNAKDVLDKAVDIARAVPVVYEIGKSIIRSASRKVEARPWNTEHLWQFYESTATGMKARPKPVCFFCRIERTAQNELELCPGPATWKA